MCESPKTLQEICIDFICRNLLLVTKIHFNNTVKKSSSDQQINHLSDGGSTDSKFDTIGEKTSTDEQSTTTDKKLNFRHPDVFLPAEISEQLLSHLSKKYILTDLTITLFDAKSTRLR